MTSISSITLSSNYQLRCISGNHGTALVQKIPVKLGEVLSYLEEETEKIGLSNLTITLDLIWMVLPPEVEIQDDSLLESRFTSGILTLNIRRWV